MDLASPHWPLCRRLEDLEHQETGNNIQDARDSSTKNRDVVTSVVVVDTLPELSATPKRRLPVGKEVHLLAESRAPTLAAISSCSVSDSAGVKERVGRNSLLSMQGLISGLPAVILD